MTGKDRAPGIDGVALAQDGEVLFDLRFGDLTVVPDVGAFPDGLGGLGGGDEPAIERGGLPEIQGALDSAAIGVQADQERARRTAGLAFALRADGEEGEMGLLVLLGDLLVAGEEGLELRAALQRLERRAAAQKQLGVPAAEVQSGFEDAESLGRVAGASGEGHAPVVEHGALLGEVDQGLGGELEGGQVLLVLIKLLKLAVKRVEGWL